MENSSAPPILLTTGNGRRSTPPAHGNNLLGSLIEFADGTTWILTKALSHAKYQRAYPPFEARQVFECDLVNDFDNLFPRIKKAVIKVKYQYMRPLLYNSTSSRAARVKPGGEDKHYWTDLLEEYQDMLKRRLSAKVFIRTLDNVKLAKEMVHLATAPAEKLNTHTTNEILALHHLRKRKCKYTPRLVTSVWRNDVDPGDVQYIPGGYVVCIAMTRIPAESLDYGKYRAYTLEEREEIRRAFKVALTWV